MREEDKNLVQVGSTGGIYPGGWNEQIFSWWEGPPPSFPVGKPIYIFVCIYIYIYIYIDIIVPACVLIPLANQNPAIFSVLQGTEKLNKFPQADKKP